MIRNILILAGLLTLIGAYTWYDDYYRQTPAASQIATTTATGQPAPDFAFETLDGKDHKLSDFKGKAIVLNFWASWCAPCVVEFPQMLALAAAGKNGSIFIFVSQDETMDTVKKFMTKQKIKSPNVLIALDRDKSIGQAFQTFKLPETYLIDTNLQIRDKIVGNSVEWNSPDMQQKIRKLDKPL